MLAFLDGMKEKQRGKSKRKKKGSRKGSLILQKTVSTFDAYTYLHARFGPPNGLQTFLAKDDSDNLFHWDYNLRAGDNELIFVGATQEIHVWFDHDLSDAECWRFIEGLKADFARVGREKGRFSGTLEKWHIFPNQYLSLANRCGELYDTIATALPKAKKLILAEDFVGNDLQAKKARSIPKLMSAITTAPTELSVLMPVMFESFVGLLVAGLTKQDLKQDLAAFNAFIRSPLNQKLTAMADNCVGFSRPLEQANPAFGRYWSVVNKRNDVIHGNVDPVKDTLEVVYFHGKRPLYRSGGDRIRQHWIGLVQQYKPQEVMDDYIATHEFIIEILDHLKPATRRSIEIIMEDTQPGWDNRRKIFGRLFPGHVATSLFEGTRFDWQLAEPKHE